MVATACFSGQALRSSMSNADSSTAELEGDLERRVSCSTSQSRVDFFWESRATPPMFSEGNVSLDAISGDIRGVIAFATANAVARVACVHIYREKLESTRAAIAAATVALPSLPVPQDASELAYRVNVPTQLGNFSVNRISQWQTTRLMFIGVGAGLPTQVVHEVWEQMIDVNTALDSLIPAGSGGLALETVMAEAINIRSNRFAGL